MKTPAPFPSGQIASALASNEQTSAMLVRALVIEFTPSGEIIVGTFELPGKKIPCDWLESSDVNLSTIAPGDHVLVFRPANESDRGVVLGRISRYRPAPQENSAKPHIAIEAAESLSLKCGESSVELRKDGKLMILGKDVLARAKRTARIKGGSVGIN